MHVLAAGFASRDEAAAAELELRDALDLGDADVRLEGLGRGCRREGYAAVLGGRSGRTGRRSCAGSSSATAGSS